MRISFQTIKSNVKLYARLCQALLEDPRTPRRSKFLLSLAIGYLFFPIDLIPDFIPVLGQLDDLLIVPGLIYLALRLIPKKVYEDHKKKIFKNS
jgi:uncharacterized membrane protein YkvA (DUF1232 family)